MLPFNIQYTPFLEPQESVIDDWFLEVQVWRHGGFGCQVVARAGAVEREIQEAVGRGGAQGTG